MSLLDFSFWWGLVCVALCVYWRGWEIRISILGWWISWDIKRSWWLLERWGLSIVESTIEVVWCISVIIGCGKVMVGCWKVIVGLLIGARFLVFSFRWLQSVLTWGMIDGSSNWNINKWLFYKRVDYNISYFPYIFQYLYRFDHFFSSSLICLFLKIFLILDHTYFSIWY